MKNENKEFIKRFVDVLKSYPGFRENDTEIAIRCINCESHRGPEKDGHLYISKRKEGHPFSCRKCDLSSAKLSLPFLQKLGIDEPYLTEYVAKNFKIRHTHVVNIDERNRKLDYKVDPIVLKSDKEKMSRLNDRLTHCIDNEDDIIRYKIVTRLSRFMRKNNINVENLTQKEISFLPIIDKHYVGFLSYFGNIINFRNMTGGNDFPRYITIKVDKNLKRSYFYTPSLLLDPLTENPKITVAEGPIDIISIHLNNKVFDCNNNIYVASASVGSFRSTIKNALSITGYYGATINLYLDNENRVQKVSEYDYSKIITTLKGFGRDFKINAILNLKSKDFGDMREEIEIGKYNLTNLLN